MRVRRVEGDDVWFDEDIESLWGGDLRLRREDGTYVIYSISESPRVGAVRVPVGQGPQFKPGLLCVIGTGTRITYPLIVTRVTPGQDLTATIEAVEQAPGIPQAEYTSIPDYAPPSWVPARRPSLDAPRAFTVTPHYSYDRNGYPVVTLRMQWLPPPRVTVGYYTLYEIIGSEWRSLANVTLTTHEIEYSRLEIPQGGEERTFGLVAMSTLGTISMPVTTTVHITRDTEAPGQVASFSANILTETILLMWEPPLNTPDLGRYELRFASLENEDVLGAMNDWNKMTLLAESVSADERQFTTTARPGIYAISAVDTSGNYGPPSFARTYIEEMPNVDIVITLAAGGGPLEAADRYLAPNRLVDADVLRAPSAGPGGSLPLTVGKLVDLDFVPAPTVNRHGYLSHTKLTGVNTLRAPSVTRAVPLGTLAFGKLVDEDTLRLHVIQHAGATGGVVLLENNAGAVALESDTDPGRVLQELGAGGGPVVQGLGFLKFSAPASTARPPVVTSLTSGLLVFGKLVDADTLKRPTVAPGVRALTMARITDIDTARAPTVTTGPAAIVGYYVLTENGADYVSLENNAGRIVQEGYTGALSLPTPSLRVQEEARRLAPRQSPMRGAVLPQAPPGPLRSGPVLPGPGWPGDYQNIERLSAELRLLRAADGTYASEGWFFSSVEFETTTPIRVRLSSRIDAYGYSAGRVMANWNPLASAVPLDDSQRGRDWDAEIYVRSMRDFEKLDSAWFSPLANANPLSGDIAAQSPWSRLVSGDWETALVQWAVRLWSRTPNITPSVKWAEVRVDVVERRESGADVVVSDEGTRVSFSSGFWEPPVVSITLTNVPEGTKIFRTVDRNGFDIQLISNGVPTTGTIDWFAIGYGKT